MTKLNDDKRFRILVCIDLSRESFRGLRYAVRLGSAKDADVTLLHVRKSDKGMNFTCCLGTFEKLSTRMMRGTARSKRTVRIQS